MAYWLISERTFARLQKGKFAASAMPLSVAPTNHSARRSTRTCALAAEMTVTRDRAVSPSLRRGASRADSTTSATGTPAAASSQTPAEMPVTSDPITATQTSGTVGASRSASEPVPMTRTSEVGRRGSRASRTASARALGAVRSTSASTHT